MFDQGALRDGIKHVLFSLTLRRISHSSEYRLVNNSQLPSHRNILCPPDGRKPINLDALLEYQAMARSSEMEHAQLLSLFNMLPLLHRNITRTHLIHSNAHKRQQPNLGIIRLQHDNCPRRQRR